MLTLDGQRFTTSRCRYSDSDGRPGATARIVVRVVPGEWDTPVLAILDTGAAWSVLDTEIAQELDLFNAGGVPVNLSTRYGEIAGYLVQAPVTLLADDGDALRVEAAIFVSPEWPEKAGTFLGYSGLLERMRFAIDPQKNDLFFGPIE